MKEILTKTLSEKIAQLDTAQPYVWRLRLSEADFRLLEQCLTAVATEKGKRTLATEEWAKPMLVYMAEWYKRRYQSGNRNELADGIDLETLWTNVGISQKMYLYKDDNGNNRWLYSTYVLGGLAIRHELGRGDNLRFLKGLCRIYHGESYTLENIDDAARAVAFRESICRKHSLYAYMRDILNGNLPFADDDIADAASDVNRFVSVMKAANDEVLRVKFRLEWRVQFSPDDESMTRSFNLLFRPEEVGEGLHQYLRFDRLHLWGMAHPEAEQHLYIYVRFMKGERNIAPESMERALITYVNHSVNDFVAFGAERGATVKHVPTERFDRIEVVMKDDHGQEYIVQTLPTTEYMQLWRMDGFGDVWTSAPQTQHDTALIFTDRCRLAEESLQHDCYTLPFKDKTYGKSEAWHWTYIYDSISIRDEHGAELTFFNRIGFDQVTTRLYNDTIHYVKGGLIRHCYIEDADFDDEQTIDELPVVFGREDLLVRHFATKDDIKDARPQTEEQAEYVEFKQPNGRYTEWTDHEPPAYGEQQLRITVKGKSFALKAFCLPRLDKEQPVVRDFATTCIRYRDLNGNDMMLQDHIPMDGECLVPTLCIRYGTEEDYYEVEVYRPTLIKEVVIDGKLKEYRQDGETIDLPYILKDRVSVNDFSRNGYQPYDCKNIGNIYTGDYLNIAGNPNTGYAALAAWRRDTHYQARLLDPLAPECLTVCFGLPEEKQMWDGVPQIAWNYDCHIEPTEGSTDDVPEFGILFQDLSTANSLICNYPIQQDDDPWGWDDVEVDYVKCFETVCKARSYFFLMKSLIDMDEECMRKNLLKPLLERHNGKITAEERKALHRMAQELGFDWNAIETTIDNNKESKI